MRDHTRAHPGPPDNRTAAGSAIRPSALLHCTVYKLASCCDERTYFKRSSCVDLLQYTLLNMAMQQGPPGYGPVMVLSKYTPGSQLEADDDLTLPVG